MPSRDPSDPHPDLRKRWEWMRSEWSRRYPDAPEPFLTCTHRPASEQQALVDAGWPFQVVLPEPDTKWVQRAWSRAVAIAIDRTATSS